MENNHHSLRRAGPSAPQRRWPASVTAPANYERWGVVPDEVAYEGGTTIIGEHWQGLRRHKWYVFAIISLGVLAGVLLTLLQVPTYRAGATIEVQSINDDFLRMKEVTPVGSWSFAADDIQSQIRIMQSKPLLERVIARLNAREPHTSASAVHTAKQNADSGAASRREIDLNHVQANLGVRALGRTRMIDVSYEANDPIHAADFVNTLADEFIAYNMEVRGQMNSQTREWINSQLRDLRESLARSEDALREYAKRSGLVILAETNNVSEEKLRRLQEEVTRAKADRMEKEARYVIAQNATPDSIPELLKDDLFRDYQSKLAALNQQRAELITAYTPEYSKVKRITAQVASLEAALNQYRTAQMDRIRNQHEEALKRESLVVENYDNETQNLIREGARSVEYSMLKREVDSNRTLYDTMLQRTKEAGMASAMKASNVKVIDPAVPPRSPARPVMALNAAIGFVGSVMVSIVFVSLRERGGMIRRPGELRTFLGIVELGSIHSAKRRFMKYGRRGSYADAAITSSHRGTLWSGSEPAGANDLNLIGAPREYSAMAQSIESVLASISFSDPRRKQPGVVVVTSPNAGEGKTTLTANLGVSLAGLHGRVLLIDADMYRPRLHEVFGIPNEGGLTDLLDRDMDPRGEALMDSVRETAVPGLFVLPAGTRRNSTLFQSPDVMRLIGEVRSRFKVVLIDTPPMLEFADARVLGRKADGVILVARSGITTRAAAMAANQRLADDRINVIGAILNDWDPKSTPGWYVRD